MPRSGRDVDVSRWDSSAGRRAIARLTERFFRNGYWRGPPDRTARPRTHRGYECRFTGLTEHDRDEIVSLLRAAGIEPGRPFAKGTNWRIPVYGKDVCERLREAFRRSRSTKPATRARPPRATRTVARAG